MSTRLLLSSSALFLALLGLVLTFAPQEIMGSDTAEEALAAQLVGAAVCGFALLNWMSKGTAMGGIYGRPLAMGNLVHFTIGGLALLKMADQLQPSWLFVALAICYLLFAALFARAAFFTSVSLTP
jgi:hypothetical protein